MGVNDTRKRFVVDGSEKRHELCTYGTHCTCQLCARAGGSTESACMSTCQCAVCISDDRYMYVCEYILYVHCVCLACQCTGSTAKIRERGGWHALATRLTPSGVCCHFSGEVPLTRCKRRRQHRRKGTVFPVCVSVCVFWEPLLCFDHVCFLPALPLFSWVLQH